MKIIKYTVLLLMLIGLRSGFAHAISPEVTAEQVRATTESVRLLQRERQERDYLAWTVVIGDVFKVPISFEWSYVNDDRSEEEIPKIQFEIKPGESLAEVLENFCKATGNRLQWGRIRGVIWVWPTGLEGTTESLLDVRVSLNLRGVSPWDAFLALSMAINASSESRRYVTPSANPIQDEYLPPLSLRDENTITLELNDVPARDAASAIMADSFLRMRIWYTNFYRPRSVNPSKPKAQMSLWAFDEQNRLLKHVPNSPSQEEGMQWHLDAESVVPVPHPESAAKPSIP